MNSKHTILGLPLPQAIGLFSFMIAIVSIWVQMEIRLAELNVEIANMKQDMMIHNVDNRRDLETQRTDINSDMKEIIRKIDEIQIYLRKNK